MCAGVSPGVPAGTSSPTCVRGASGCGAGRDSATGCGVGAGGCGTGTGRFSTTGGGATVCVATCCGGGGTAGGRAVVPGGWFCVLASCSSLVFSAAIRLATSSLTFDGSMSGEVDVGAAVPRAGAVVVAANDVVVRGLATTGVFVAVVVVADGL